jgi:hypothetical protein
MKRSLKKKSRSLRKSRSKVSRKRGSYRKKVLVVSKPERVSRVKIGRKNELITPDHPYFRTRVDPPTSREYFKDKTLEFEPVLKSSFPDTCYMGTKGFITPEVDGGCTTLEYDLNYKNHWGQRKLLLTEIDFLTLVLKSRFDSIDIVYAGAAAGIHIPFLFRLFPNIRFHLYDPAKFRIQNLAEYEKTGKITINEYYKGKKNRKDYGFFTDDVARYYRKKFYKNEKESNMLFISDIRLGAEHIEGETRTDYSWRFEEGVLRNNEEHQDWIRIMRPKWSMLKFKEPYVKEDREKFYKYMKGEIRLQTWHPLNSAETRLIVKNSDINKEVYYNIIAYERKNAYYNYLRQMNLNNKLIDFIPNTTLKDFCKHVTKNVPYYNLDFFTEILIYYRYLKKYENMSELLEDKAEKLKNTIINYMRDTTTLIYGSPERFRLIKHEK